MTLIDEPNTPFAGTGTGSGTGTGVCGTGARFGEAASLETFTDTRWVTVRGDIAPYPS